MSGILLSSSLSHPCSSSLPSPPFFFSSLCSSSFLLLFATHLSVPISSRAYSHHSSHHLICTLFICAYPQFFPPLFPFTRIFPYLFCANTHYLVLLFPPLFFTLDPVVFASPSLSSNQINWCETIHFHIFLWSLERRLWSDLNLHVREGI